MIEYDSNNYRILLVEDDELNRKVALRILEKKGFSVTVVSTGVEAIETVRELKFDLILMDINMPELDGVSATAEIRKIDKMMDRRTPVIALTAYALKGDEEKFIQSGLDDYVSKPIILETFLDKVNKWLR